MILGRAFGERGSGVARYLASKGSLGRFEAVVGRDPGPGIGVELVSGRLG